MLFQRGGGSINRLLRNNKGFTLIEIILTLTLMIIVLGVTYNIFFTGNKIFNMSKSQSLIQNDVRIAAEYITKELKNAIFIYDNVEFLEGEDEYYSLELKGDESSKNLLRRAYTKFNNTTSVEENILGNFLTDLKFSPSDNSSLLSITISAKEKEQDYTLEFKIMLNNIPNIALPEEDIHRIFYVKP